MRRQITRKSLDELARELQTLSPKEQERYYGGGDGSPGSPYTVDEYRSLYISGAWTGGYVWHDNEPHYVTRDIHVVGRDKSGSVWGNVAQGVGATIGYVADALGGYAKHAGKDYLVYNSQGAVIGRLPIPALSPMMRGAILGGGMIGAASEVVPLVYRIVWVDGGLTKENTIEAISTGGGMYIGAKAGGAAGAIMCTVFGPVGTAFGAVIGGLVGGVIGGEVISGICYVVCDWFDRD